MSLTYRQFTEMEACRASLLEALTAEMKWRRGRDFPIWVLAERKAVLDAANRWILDYTDNSTLTLSQVEEVENMAVGHSDYAHKFVLYVSDLIYGMRLHVED